MVLVLWARAPRGSPAGRSAWGLRCFPGRAITPRADAAPASATLVLPAPVAPAGCVDHAHAHGAPGCERRWGGSQPRMSPPGWAVGARSLAPRGPGIRKTSCQLPLDTWARPGAGKGQLREWGGSGYPLSAWDPALLQGSEVMARSPLTAPGAHTYASRLRSLGPGVCRP